MGQVDPQVDDTDASACPWVPSLTISACLFAGSIALIAAGAILHPHELWNELDLLVYRWGGDLVSHGGDLYGVPLGYLPFTYPPFAALVFAPIDHLPVGGAQLLVTTASIASILVAVRATLAIAGWPATRARLSLCLAASAVTLWLEPVQATLRYGQINLVLMALVLWDLSRADDRPAKGALVGIAAGMKLTPALFAVYLLVTGRTRAAAVAAGTFVMTVVVGGLLAPSATSDFWGGLLFLDPKRTGDVAFVGNQSLRGAALRVFGDTGAVHAAVLVASLAVAVVGIQTARRAHRAGHEATGILLCALTGLLVSPISWTHHWVWAVPALACLLATLAQRPSRRLGALVAIAFALLAAWPMHRTLGEPMLPGGVVWLAMDRTGGALAAGFLPLVWSVTYTLAGLGVLVWAALRYRPEPRPIAAREAVVTA
jgi:alpha-1,2-mannosyltransferase